MRTRDLIWYDVGLIIGTTLVAIMALARQLLGRDAAESAEAGPATAPPSPPATNATPEAQRRSER